MAVTVSLNPADFDLKIISPPLIQPPVIAGSNMRFSGSKIELSGFATLLGQPSDSPQGWKIGFIQAQWVETNWSSYRGLHHAEGSIFIQRGRTPARLQRVCRDCVDRTPVAAIFYNTRPGAGELAFAKASDSFPLVLPVRHYDSPADECILKLQNTLTGKPNFLREAQFEFLFYATLSVQGPSGAFRHLVGVYWNVRWQYIFDQPGFRPQVVPAGTGATVSGPFRGSPTDPRFTSVLASPAETRSCNDIFRAALNAFNPGSPNRHESRVWTNYDVTAP